MNTLSAKTSALPRSSYASARPKSGGLSAAFDARALLEQPDRERHRSTADGFWSRVDQSAGVDACWPWRGTVLSDGYGRIKWCRIDTSAHRVAYSLTKGPIPAGLVVLHSCDNRACCNPAHLSTGTIADNVADMLAKGRARTNPDAHRGAKNTNAKLTDDLVREYRAAWRAGEAIASIVARTGLSVGTVHPMLHGKTWVHVTSASEAAS